MDALLKNIESMGEKVLEVNQGQFNNEKSIQLQYRMGQFNKNIKKYIGK